MGRAAAETQGVVSPAETIQARLRSCAFCGAAEVTPIHPFELETSHSETATIDEGLYVFEPGALGPHCGTVTSAALGDRPGEARHARRRSKVLEQIWQDFAPFRETKG